MQRIKELDFLKCLLIMLMVTFHLVYIGDSYPVTKQVVYTFHMSGFLIVSGYLANVSKPAGRFLHDTLWIFLPYAVMEAAYTYMAGVLPTRETVGDVSPLLFVENVFLSPIGPYWYLHTLLVCNITYYLANRLKLSEVNLIIVFALCLYVLSRCSLLSFGNAIYYIIGVACRQKRTNLLQVFSPTWLAVIPFAVLISFPANLERGTLAGVAITFCAVSFMLSLYRYCPQRIKDACCFVGQNTLAILLFSPIFTFASKCYLPLFSFDPSGMLFMLVSVALAISGCLLMVYACDRLNLSRWFFGKQVFLKR